MKVMTTEDIKLLMQHLDIARTEIQKTITDLAKGGVSVTAVHIIALECVATTEHKMREMGVTEKGLANCKKLASDTIKKEYETK